jgi:hypothetical protein
VIRRVIPIFKGFRKWKVGHSPAVKREERKLEKQLVKSQHQLNGVRAAAKALGD